MVTSSMSEGHLIPGLANWEGHQDYSIVPEWLNAASGTDSYVRVMNLIDEIHQVESGFEQAARAGWYVSTTSRPRTKAVENALRDLNRRHDRINDLLRSYQFSPAIVRVLCDSRWMLFMFGAPVEGEYICHRVLHKENQKLSDGSWLVESHLEYDISEANVVLRILNLAAAWELERVRQCRRCSKWFYAERSHQKFCSMKCRLDSYSKSPKYKNYRKAYMRRRRANDPARKSAERARRKGR